MNKAELESKHLSELHTLAAEAGVPRYRMLPRAELIEKLLDGKPGEAAAGGREREPRQRPRRERPRREQSVRAERTERTERPERAERPKRERPAEKPAREQPRPASAEPATAPRRRRRRFGRKAKGLRVNDLLLPPPGRQALVCAESREACTALLRGVAAELAGASKGPDPIALLVDPSPEELAEWKRDAPEAEIVAAGKARHASDAVAQAARRAEDGEDVILLVDSLTKLEDADAAREIFDAGLARGSAKGSLTVVAALERPA